MEMYRPPYMAGPPPPPPPYPGPSPYPSGPARESSPSRQSKAYIPSAKAQLILNRMSMDQPRSYSPAPRLPPRMPPPSYYDYDYGYGGYGGYGGYPYGGYPVYAPPPVPRYSSRRYELDDDVDLSHMPRYRPHRYSDTLAEIEKEKMRISPSPSVHTPPHPSANFMPGHIEGEDEGLRPAPVVSSQTRSKTREPGPSSSQEMGHSSLSEPQMLQDQVDKMRMRLKNLAYSLDPTGPVPEIVVPERSRRSEIGKYSSGMELAELPRTTRKQHYYPEDDHMKDNLRIKCLSHYKTTRTAAGYCKPKLYEPSEALSNTYTSKYPLKTDTTLTKWEEPDTVYGTSSDKKPFSKVETGSSIFSTYGYTNRSKDTVAEKVRDYYYFGDAEKPEEEAEDETKKERRKKKKSKERDEVPAVAAAPAPEPAVETAPTPAAAPAAEPASETTEAVSAPTETPAEGGEEELDEKEKKRLEKKKRKAEREAAAKAAMEAELAALAAAEAELAKLEAEASKSDEPAAPVADSSKGSEPAVEKCESQPAVANEDLPECPPTELEPEPAPSEPVLESTASEPVPEADEVVAEAVPGSEIEAEEQQQQEVLDSATAEPEQEAAVIPAPDAPEPPEATPAPAGEEASSFVEEAPSVPLEQEQEETPMAKPRSSQGEEAFDWSSYEAQGQGGGDEEAPKIGTQESVQEEKNLQEGGEEVTAEEPTDTQPEESQEQKLQEPDEEQTPESTEQQTAKDLPTESENPIEEEPVIAEETAASEETPQASDEPQVETAQEVTPQDQNGSTEQTQEEPTAEFKPLDESDSIWGEEE